MLVDDADEARKMFYRLSRAHEVLTDEQGERIYDESLGDRAPRWIAFAPSTAHRGGRAARTRPTGARAPTLCTQA